MRKKCGDDFKEESENLIVGSWDWMSRGVSGVV